MLNEETKLVIFDCDGVLVDSELISNSVFANMLVELGIPADLEMMYQEFKGNSMSTCMKLVEQKLGKPAPLGFEQDYRERCSAKMQRDLKPIEGIQDALSRLSLPTCVASSGSHEKMKMTLGLTGLLSSFEGRIFSVDDVDRPKPYPDVYLFAAKQMGFEAPECIVVEDSAIGVRAAVAAGMHVLGYCADSCSDTLREHGAQTFNSMQELPAIIDATSAR